MSSVCGDGERYRQWGSLLDHSLPQVPGQLPWLTQPQPQTRSWKYTPALRRYHTLVLLNFCPIWFWKHFDKSGKIFPVTWWTVCVPLPLQSGVDSPTCSNGVTPSKRSKSHSSVKYPSASSSASSSTSSSPSSVNYSESNSSDSTKSQPHSTNSTQETR